MELATATPSKKYRWYSNLSNCILSVRKSGTQVRFYSVINGKEKCLNKTTIKELFPVGKRIKDQPFLKKENKEFYSILKS